MVNACLQTSSTGRENLQTFCNRSNLDQLSEAVSQRVYVNSQRGAVRECRGLMIDGIEPAKCVQLAIEKCQSIQPILRIAIRASRFCADARDFVHNRCEISTLLLSLCSHSVRKAIVLLVSSNQSSCCSETELCKLDIAKGGCTRSRPCNSRRTGTTAERDCS